VDARPELISRGPGPCLSPGPAAALSLTFFFFLFLFFLLPAGPLRAFAEEPGEVVLDAERVSYDDETGRAAAEGGAVLTYQGTTIHAERIDYDASTQTVKAAPLPGESVRLQRGGRTVTGDGLEYNLLTSEGVLLDAQSRIPIGEGALYVSGGSLQILPYGLAAERGLVRRDDTGQAYIGIWENVSATTCTLDHPHYRIETKRILFVPGRRLVAKRPRLYLGDTYIFTYPMDYIAQLDRKALKHSIVPYAENDGHKGAGTGLSGAFAWESGSVSLGASYWSRVGGEWTAEIDQRIAGALGIRGGVTYSWDGEWDEKTYHPHASLYYEDGGWRIALGWIWKEYIEDRKDSLYKYKGRLDRKPEFSLLTPWWKDPAAPAWHRLGAAWGAYREETLGGRGDGDFVARYGAAAQSYGEIPLGSAGTGTGVGAGTGKPLSGVFDFFWNVSYGAWFYDRDGGDSKFLEGILGVRGRLGPLDLGLGYERRFVDGNSPMLWDSLREAEKIHQKIRFPLGRELFAAARGSYDLRESFVDEVHYALQWITDCMKWELAYHDDRTPDANDRIGLSLSLLAFPNTPASFGQYKDTDPFARPEDLP
jgi:LPS-assembly protein